MAVKLDEGESELSEINVTPFIDVILVLLIVFMVAAPLSTVDIAVDLPGSTAPSTDRPDEPLWLTFTADRSLMLHETALDTAALAAALDAETGGKRDTPVFLRADRSIDYGALMGVLDALRAAGYLKVALVGLEGAQ
ncbi:TonB system transport protein ExbD [Xinfangfangia sp. CPCC 101601]|uniref:Biopolymer transport protein ExbD n=1 Tax=Pseudogemmobacter lacusdianii TaxID=3069608 RepID=A0ABU0W1S3_9RHOB|nr:TonB system transport protein ExbD [Xinfangfangia sp. CPCC 101601]MDQ2067974.1 TonB system transport protein ExbD [Xinfangfangia sp. CPCC 101601]